MLIFVVRRLLQSAVVVLLMSALVFAGVFAVGDPIQALVSPQATQEDIRRTVEQFGLDKPLWAQYVQFLNGALHGNLGNSFAFGLPAIQLVIERMPATLELALLATMIALGAGVPLGLWAGLRPNSFVDRSILSVSILGFSLPTFWVGLLLIMLFSVQLGWLPAGGRGETRKIMGIALSCLTLDGLRHILLPAVTLSLLNIALVIRLTRAGTQEAMLQDYVKFARAKGLFETRVVGVHVLKNIAIPVLTVIALQFGSIIAFAIVTETIFAWPGMGKLIIDAIQLLDRPVIVAYLMVIVVLFVVINLFVDLMYMLLDPRIRMNGSEA